MKVEIHVLWLIPGIVSDIYREISDSNLEHYNNTYILV